MTNEELRQLLPFYVAGTLGPEERERVDEALKSSEELREDLQFWLHAQHAILSQTAHTAAGHLGAQSMVDCVEGILPEPQRSLVRAHLQTCRECSEEYQLVEESLAGKTAPSTSGSSRLFDIIKSVRLVYAVPTFAAMIVAVILYFNSSERSAHQPSVPDSSHSAVAAIARSIDESAPLWLTYQSDMRSTSRKSIPTLSLGERVKRVNVFIAIPHSQLSDIRYHVEVGLEEERPNILLDSLRRFAAGTAYDTLHIALPRNIIPQPGDTLNLMIKEILSPSMDLTPEEYRFYVLIAASSEH
jgi:anti-sigma factor RsiW